MTVHDVAVVGAGPAGLAAAVSAAEAGAQVLLVDAGERPGGQYWRHRHGDDEHERGTSGEQGDAATGHGDDEHERGTSGEQGDAAIGHGDDAAGHHDWAVFQDLRRRLADAEAAGLLTFRPGTTVWLLERHEQGFRLRTTPTVTKAAAGSAVARRVVLCPGAYDRQLPVPGWDLPGVLAAGGAQALLKGGGVVAGARVVVAGTGPFLLPVAAGLAEAGADVVALCEAAAPGAWLRHSGAALGKAAKLAQLAEYATVLARHRVRPRTRTVVTQILGTDRVEAVRLGRLHPRGRPADSGPVVEADAVALGWGFTPQLELPLMLGVQTALGADGSLVVRVDPRQRTSVPGVHVAGEATGVGGAMLAVAEGHVAGRAAAGAEPDRLHRREVLRHRAFARAMHAVHRVPERWADWLTPETLVCRCEEVTAGEVTDACDRLGADDPRGARSLARVGMGRCQGRICGFATADLLAARRGAPVRPEDLRTSAARPLAAHVPMGTLAELVDDPDPA
ncbi:NAD(P)/FAD-dependent oxidoreductase [Georgenia alba]|uniref:NAD(P)/FAD-dependent oxidoreductase n=1 Tax=Georgenia alba TaxID=2233858 RepID=A0ABW2Q3K0_9MICO